jgi:UPF0042 nucleotide-binding protein
VFEEFRVMPPGSLQVLADAEIPHSVCGGVAVCLHGYQRNTTDVDLIIERERAKLEEIRAQADVVIDTSNLNVHQLEKRTSEIFAAGMLPSLRVNVLSFGYKYGIPVDADLVLDCRFIPNPHWIPELRPLNGLDKPVSDKVLSSEGVEDFVKSYVSVVQKMIPGYFREGKKYVTIAIGCTGGKHRSVAIAEEIARQLSTSSKDLEITAHATHRDVGRE